MGNGKGKWRMLNGECGTEKGKGQIKIITSVWVSYNLEKLHGKFPRSDDKFPCCWYISAAVSIMKQEHESAL